ncbi:uncharacterized protein LOC111898331 isoform X2 [Lactuca sativa]|uniref:uncharacterized protein LOC111898331 isoform X2 n=1 Tax=Lactuca sativa TaxID=4236 RepID=UPI000CD937B4|nr:uncharacterized protein LOC111898331 isoform X2 [Lactuca sativa]
MEEQRQPSSPEMAKFQLKDTIEALLKLTLTLSIEESLDLGLSKEFCSNLLKDDEDDHTYPSSTSNTDLSEGVPPYPLYKHLASALCKSISNGAVHSMNANIPLIHEDSSMKQKEREWNKFILEKGSDLVNMLETVEFGLHVQEPFFSQIKDGKKTIEGRCAGGDYNRIESGSLVLFNKCLLLQVHDVHCYGSFSDMLATEDLAKVLPGVETVEEGVEIYRRFYSEEKERENGVLAMFLTKPTSQLYNHLAAILEALHYEGVTRLFGISHTVGTIPDALPLPRSSLLSAFLTPHNPNVKTSILSDGARALAKHVNRSNGKFWGSFAGNGWYLLFYPFGRVFFFPFKLDLTGHTEQAYLVSASMMRVFTSFYTYKRFRECLCPNFCPIDINLGRLIDDTNTLYNLFCFVMF